MNLDLNSNKIDFGERMDAVEHLIDPALYSPLALQVLPGVTVNSSPADVRGLAIVLLFSGYENLVKCVVRAMNDAINREALEFGKCPPGLRVLASRTHFEGITGVGPNRIWERIFLYLNECQPVHKIAIPLDRFPDDGSHMRVAQLNLIAQLYGLDAPGKALWEAKPLVDTVVAQRN